MISPVKAKMAAYLINCILLALIGLCSIVATSAEENTPIIAWSNSKSLAEVNSLGQEPLFTSIYNIMYKNEKLILFTLEKMSFDDLAKYGGLYGGEGALKNIENYIDTSVSSAILSVPYQPNMINFFINELSYMYNVDKIRYFTAEGILANDEEFVNSDCKFCIISLPEAPSSSVSDQASSLAESDKFIGLVMAKDVVRQDKYIAVVTAKYSQMHTKEQSTLKRAARQEPPASNNKTNCSASIVCVNSTNTSTANDSCYFFMRFQEIVIMNNFTSINTTIHVNSTYNTSGSSCGTMTKANSTYRNIAVEYTNPNITIIYKIPTNTSLALPTGFWTLELELLDFPDDTFKYKQEGLPPYPLAIPNGASFHCSNATFCVESDSDKSRCNVTKPYVIIRRMQAELFTTNGYKRDFSIAYDCESYFTATTWMGVLTLSILLPILIIALFLVFQTQTMDRFDDPREPALVTTVTD